MITIKKVASATIPKTSGTIIDSFDTTDDKHTNAPSIAAVNNKINTLNTSGVPFGSTIEYYGDTIPDGFELSSKKTLLEERVEDIEDTHIYSNDEVAIGNWFGSILYRKCFQGTNLTDSGLQVGTIPIGAKVVRIYGAAYATHNQYWPIPNIFSSDAAYNLTAYVESSNGEVTISAGSYYKGEPKNIYRLVVEYTKD